MEDSLLSYSPFPSRAPVNTCIRKGADLMLRSLISTFSQVTYHCPTVPHQHHHTLVVPMDICPALPGCSLPTPASSFGQTQPELIYGSIVPGQRPGGSCPPSPFPEKGMEQGWRAVSASHTQPSSSGSCLRACALETLPLLVAHREMP